MTAPELGSVLANKYRVEQVLGVGGMGAVVAAHHLQLDQKVAIKYLLPEAMKSPEVVERFAREARAAAKIRGEHVARIIDVGQFDDGAPYMVMEYLEGTDLAKELERKGQLAFEDAVRYILEACEALAEAHVAKIVHRDLKPANLFLAKQPDKRSIVKVLDFGISKVGDNAQSAALTKTSALMGTAFYMSPEQMTSPKTVDHRSDIWSLGVILYELLAGKTPFPGETVAEIIAGILTNQPESLRKHRNDVPSGLKTVVDTCMQSKAADRYEDVAKLAAALGPFAAPGDRASIDVTARVLGASMRPSAAVAPPPSSETVVMPSSATIASQAIPAPSSPVDPPASGLAASVVAPTPLPGSAPNVGGITTHGVSTSAITHPKPRSMTAIIGVGALVAVGLVAAGGFVMKDRTAGPSPPSTGMVGAAPSAPPSAQPLVTANATATPTTEPAQPSATAIQPGPTRIVQYLPPSGKPAASTAKSAIASAVASAPPPPPTTTAAATASATTNGQNPLNMGIK